MNSYHLKQPPALSAGRRVSVSKRAIRNLSMKRLGWRLAACCCLLFLAGGPLRLGQPLRAAAPVAYAFQSSGPARSVWSDTTVPGTTDTQVDSSAVELGMKFRASANGYITGVR